MKMCDNYHTKMFITVSKLYFLSVNSYNNKIHKSIFPSGGADEEQLS
jgi:hypothetical protein